MAVEDKKAARQQLSRVTSTLISPARIRNFIDTQGINHDVEQKLTVVKDKIHAIMKEGGPQKPVAPESLKKDASELQKTKHEEARNKYEAELAKYNDFQSERYRKVETVYKLCKKLNKVHGLLLKDKRNANQEKELEDLRAVVHDKLPARKSKETEEVYSRKVKEFKPEGYKHYVADTDLHNADATQNLINKLKKDYPDVTLFLQKDEVSRSRIRFNDAGAVTIATAMELGIEELLEHGIENTIKSEKKTIQPDHCVSPGLDKCKWYLLFRNLPHLRAVLERQERKAEYDSSKKEQKKKAIQKAKSDAKRHQKPYQKPKLTQATFQETEVVKNYAVKTEVTTVDDKGANVVKVYYNWYGIDIEREDTSELYSGINFNFYIGQLCKKVIKRLSEIDTDYQDIKISTNIRKFFSDLIIDFISRISPQIRLLIDAMDVKTVDHNVIKTVLKMMVVDNYHSSTGLVKLDDEHESLFKQIDEKVQMCQAHQTSHVTKDGEKELKYEEKEDEKEDEKEEDEDEENDSDSEEEKKAVVKQNGNGKPPAAKPVVQNGSAKQQTQKTPVAPVKQNARPVRA